MSQLKTLENQTFATNRKAAKKVKPHKPKKNRLCDGGGWFCPGQYPPALQKILVQKKDFKQLEDFNKGGDDSAYQKEYFDRLAKKKGKAVGAAGNAGIADLLFETI